MKNSSAVVKLPRHHLWRMGLVALLCLALVLVAACGGDATATPEPTSAPATATPEPQAGDSGDSDEGGHANGNGDSSDSDADNAGHEGDDEDSGKVEAPANGDSDSDSASGQSSASSSEDSTDNGSEGSEDSDSGDSSGSGASGSDGTVSNENPGGEGMPFDNSRNVALFGAEPLNIVQWTVEPTAGAGDLVAEGMLTQDAVIFNPMVDGEGSGFSVFYKGHEESMVELLPALGPMFVWDTFQTVAETEMEIEGLNFTIRAYSPLFMDVGPGDLELRVYGYLPSGEDALLSVQDINAE